MHVIVEAGDELDRLETERTFTAGLPAAVVRSFRMRMQQLRAITCLEDLENSRALDVRRTRGSLPLSIRLIDDWRLQLQVARKPDGLHLRAFEVAQKELKVRSPK